MVKKKSKVDEDKEMHDSRVKWLIKNIGRLVEFDTKYDAKKIDDLALHISFTLGNVDHIPTDAIKEAFKTVGLNPLVEESIKAWCADPDASGQDYIYNRTAKVMLLIRLLHDDYYVHWKHVGTMQQRCQTCKFCTVSWDVAREMYDSKPSCNRVCISRTINRSQQDIDTRDDFWEVRPLP